MAASPRPPPSIDLLLNLVPDRPDSILASLANHPTLASAADANGYTLLHAASSYAQLDLLRTLVQTYSISPNVVDADGDSPLFYAETVDVARCLVEELGADISAKNAEGETVVERAESEEWILVAKYLREKMGGVGSRSDEHTSVTTSSESNGVHAPPPLPDGVKINIGHVSEDTQEMEDPDPEFRRRIEELAARDDFQGEEGQKQLRELITDAVRGVAVAEQHEDGRSVRRRLD